LGLGGHPGLAAPRGAVLGAITGGLLGLAQASAQIALAWLIRIPNVVVIPGASRASQVAENAAAADIALSDEEAARLLAEAERFSP